jgi:protein TonB
MLRSPTTVKAIAFAASGAAHVAAFAVVAAGHASASGSGLVERAAEPAAEVAVEPLRDEAPPDPAPATELAARPQPRTHMRTHPYPLLAPLAPAPVLTADQPEAPPRFTIVVGGSQNPLVVASAIEHGVAPAGSGAPEPISVDRTTTPARVLSISPPRYPPQARAMGVEAKVILEIIVDAAGRVTASRLVQAAGLGFDEAALSAIGQYRFAPATVGGRAVPVRMRWAVEFRLD